MGFKICFILKNMALQFYLILHRDGLVWRGGVGLGVGAGLGSGPGMGLGSGRGKGTLKGMVVGGA